MKKYFNFNIKTIAATGLGAALFTLLFMFVKIPTGFPDVSIQSAYGVGAFLAALFGPLAGGLAAFIGHAVADVSQGTLWWSWIIASCIAMFITGFVFTRLKVEEGEFSVKDIIIFNVYQVIGHLIAWCLVAPALDVLVYSEPAAYAFTQGIWAAIPNIISSGVIGSVLLFLYSRVCAKKGSPAKEA